MSPGSYVITEAALGGWSLTNLVIVDPDNGSSVDLVSRTATLDVDPGEALTVTFTNTKLGTITIVKDGLPNDAQDFTYTTTGVGLSPFTLDDDPGSVSPTNSQLFVDLAPGTFTITEGAVSGWTLSSIGVTGAASYSTSGSTTTVNLAAGENVVVRYTNTKLGTINVIKNAVPDDSADFSFTGTTPLGSFQLDDDADGTLPSSLAFNSLLPGTYVITEAALAGWDLTNLVISDPDSGSSVDLATRTATLDVDPGEVLTVTFTNTKRGSITVVKDAVPNDPQDFSFAGGLGVFSLDDDSDPTLANNQLFASLVPGTYVVSEAALGGWDLTSLVVSDPDAGSSVDLATRTATIDLDPGESITVTFTNTKRGSITVVKDAVPDDAQDFSFTGGLGAFSLDDDGDPTLPNSQLFANQVPGTYVITETALVGWTLTNLVINDPDGGSSLNLATRTATIDLDPGETINVRFTNTVTPAFTGTKFYDLVTDGVRDADGADNVLGNSDDEVGLPGWTIELYRDVDSDGQFEPNGPFGVPGDDGDPVYTTVTDANGNYALAPLSLPNGRYFIREVIRSGWQQTSGPNFFTFNYAGSTIANVDFGNASCTGTLFVADGPRVVTSQRDGILTLVLTDPPPMPSEPNSQGTFSVTRVGGGAFDAYDGAGGVLAGATSVASRADAAGQRVDILIGANDYLHAGAHPTPPGTQFAVTISGSGGAGTFVVLNAVNVDVAGSLALIITGTECGELIAVDDDTGGTASDAKAIYFGTVEGAYNGGANLTSTGIKYNTPILDAMFGVPTLSRVDVFARGGDDIVRITEDIVQQTTLDAGTGNDNVRAGTGRAYIAGGAGIDLLVGGAADDIIYGGLDHDRIFAAAGADRAYGDVGDDWIAGGVGDDPLLRGGDGSDWISGGGNRDRLYGDAGYDYLYRDAGDYLVDVGFGGGVINNTPPDPVEQALQDLLTKYWNDANADALDTLDELINVILP